LTSSCISEAAARWPASASSPAEQVMASTVPNREAATAAPSLRTAERVLGRKIFERFDQSRWPYLEPTKCSLWKAR
jgi:hypothetical protein